MKSFLPTVNVCVLQSVGVMTLDDAYSCASFLDVMTRLMTIHDAHPDYPMFESDNENFVSSCLRWAESCLGFVAKTPRAVLWNVSELVLDYHINVEPLSSSENFTEYASFTNIMIY